MQNTFLRPEKEIELFNRGYDFVVGVDEVGRGAWAGPLYLCAYIYSESEEWIEGIKDSKLLSETRREKLYKYFNKDAYKLEIISNNKIDELGLGIAMCLGLKNLIESIRCNLKLKKIMFIVDGHFKGEWDEDTVFETKADRNVYSVACASVIAKVTRDRFMKRIASKYPEYLFEQHVGYGTKHHIEALNQFGLCDIHRKSYKPVNEIAKKTKS